MGMFDEVVLDPPLRCSGCGAAIDVLQTHAFEEALSRYRVGDCVGHAEELRVVREAPWCPGCRKAGEQEFVYLVVVRGILMAVEEEFEVAQRRLREPSMEELVLWYHDLDQRRTKAESELRSHRRFLEQLREYLASPESTERVSLPNLFQSYFEGVADPREALDRYLAQHPELPDGSAGCRGEEDRR